jgi:predicted PurR-regulated permease PerM
MSNSAVSAGKADLALPIGEIDDQTSAAPPLDPWVRASQISTIGLFVIATLWCVYVAQPVIVPVLLAWAIATIVMPVVAWLQRQGLPRVAAVLIVTFLLLGLLACLFSLLSSPVTYWAGRASELAVLIKQKLSTVSQPLALLEEVRNAFGSIGSAAQPAVKVDQQPATMMTLYSIIAPAVSQLVLFLGALIFYLVYQKRLRDASVHFLKHRKARLIVLRTLTDIDECMTTYFGTFTAVNVCLGLAVAALTWAIGLPNPLLWGVLAGLLNYVPYIGPAIVALTLGMVGLLSFTTFSQAAIAPLAFIAMVTIEGQFLTPTIMGRRLELNPFAVFLSIAVWTWLWGPIGAFLAVPLLIALTAAFGRAFPATRPQLPD